jgi:5'-nucleotidase
LVPRRTTLVTNDDGIDSPGLVVLAAAAVRAGLDVVVAAPARQSSGTSAGIIATTRAGRPLIKRRQLPDLPEIEALRGAGSTGLHRACGGPWLAGPGTPAGGVRDQSGRERGARDLASRHGGRSADGRGERSARAGGLPRCRPLPGAATMLEHRRAPAAGRPGAPAGTVLSLNVPDRPIEALGELRPAALAQFGTVQTRVDRVEDGQLHLAQVEVDAPPEPGTDSALLAAGHPTLTALESVCEASNPVLPQSLASGAAARVME